MISGIFEAWFVSQFMTFLLPLSVLMLVVCMVPTAKRLKFVGWNKNEVFSFL